MRVRNPEQSGERWRQHSIMSEAEWIEESIRAYLDGRSPLLKWIAGTIHAHGDIPAASNILLRLEGYGSQARYDELKGWFEAGALITILPRFVG